MIRLRAFCLRAPFVITSAEMSIDAVSPDAEREEPLSSQKKAGAASEFTSWFSASNARLLDAAMPFGALGLAACGVLWAIDSGVSPPLAIMVGYCAAASTLALYAVARTLRPEHAEEVQSAPASTTTSEAWKLVNTLTVSDASRLWCDIEPGATATQESMAWGRALLDAIKRGELPVVARPGVSEEAAQRERENPHYMTQISRDALQVWASGHGYAPNFLR